MRQNDRLDGVVPAVLGSSGFPGFVLAGQCLQCGSLQLPPGPWLAVAA